MQTQQEICNPFIPLRQAGHLGVFIDVGLCPPALVRYLTYLIMSLQDIRVHVRGNSIIVLSKTYHGAHNEPIEQLRHVMPAYAIIDSCTDFLQAVISVH